MRNPLLEEDELQQLPTPMPSPVPSPSPMATPQVPLPTRPAQMPPVQAPQAAPQIPPSQPPAKLPGMPPTVTPNLLQSYLGKQRDSLSTYGPEKQMALQDQTLRDRNSFQTRATSGLKGLADAIMQGVAGAGNPGWQQSFDQRQDQMAGERMDTLRKANDSNIQRTATGMNIDQMDPGSPLSQSAQETYAPLFQKLGYQGDALKSMSAANIQNALSLMTQFGGMEIQSLIKQYELEIERARLAAAQGKNASDEKIAEENQRLQAAKELAGRGTENRTFGGLPIPFTKKPTEASELGTKYLKDKLSGGLSSEDQEALNWANANPEDPRSEKIKSRLGQ